ncbi:MAG: immunoglobulin-like domain-containing protein, partial [Glaciecola sp.]
MKQSLIRLTSIASGVLFLASCGGGNSAPVNTPPAPTPIADTTAPVISLGSVTSPIQITVGDSFTNPTATATDNVDGNVSVSVSGSVGTTVGSYTLTYSANDAAGNSASTNV